MRKEYTPFPGQDWAFLSHVLLGGVSSVSQYYEGMLFLQMLTCSVLSNEALESLSSRIFLPLCRQCLVTTSLDSMVMVRWVELPHNYVSRDVGNVFLFFLL